MEVFKAYEKPPHRSQRRREQCQIGRGAVYTDQMLIYYGRCEARSVLHIAEFSCRERHDKV